MDDSSLLSFKILTQDILGRHKLLRESSDSLEDYEPLISYSGFKIYFGDLHSIPQFGVYKYVELIGGLDGIEFEYDNKLFIGNIDYSFVEFTDVYALLIGLNLVKSGSELNDSAKAIIAYTEKAGIPVRSNREEDLTNVFVGDVLSTHFKVFLNQWSFADTKHWFIRGSIVNELVNEYFEKNQ
jgi:hypothetical protein